MQNDKAKIKKKESPRRKRGKGWWVPKDYDGVTPTAVGVGGRRPRLCMVVHAYYPHDESRVQRQALALSEKGHGVDVICLRKGKEPLCGKHDGINFYRLPVKRTTKPSLFTYLFGYSFFFSLASLKLIELFLEKRYRVIQFHNPPDALAGAGLIPKILGTRIILDIHDLVPELYAAKFNILMSHPLIRLLLLIERVSCGFAHRVLIVTDIWKERLLARGVKGEKLSVVINLPDESMFKPMSVEKNQKQFNLVYHGTLVKRYGVDVAVRAVGVVKDKIHEIKLNIVGEGEELSELIKLCRTLSLQDKVYFSCKFVPVAEIPEIIARMDVGIVPNRLNNFTRDILNAKLLEYVAMGIPVIVSRTPGISYYFAPSMVLFFEPGNPEDLAQKILWLYDNPKERAEFADNAKRFLKEHSWMKEKEKYYQIIKELYI